MRACAAAAFSGGRLRTGSRSGRRSFASFEAGLDEADHGVHEPEQLGSARRSCQGLGFIALVELTQAGHGGQRREAREEAVCWLAEISANSLGQNALEGVVAGAGAAAKLGLGGDDAGGARGGV